MATVQEQPRAQPAARYEAFVDDRLARARGRVRLLDVSAGLLGLFLGTLAYGVGMALVDRWLELPPLIRQLGFLLYVVFAGVMTGWLVVRPLLGRVNPYYAARQVEQVLPSAKNSVINWLDLRGEPLPPAIRTAVSSRAAKELSQADLDQAISSRNVLWLAGASAALFLLVLILAGILGPAHFFSFLGRAFSPFGEGTSLSRTRITIVQPEQPETVVPLNQSVQFVVRVDGRVPDPRDRDAVRLQFRYSTDEPVWAERLMERGDSPRDWTLRLPADQVRNGFWYKVAGGDFVTQTRRVQVRSSPLVTGFDVTYQFRPYLQPYMHGRQIVSKDGNLVGLRGTEVTLLAHTNRQVKEGRMLLAGGIDKTLPAEIVLREGNPFHSLRFRLVLERDGEYRISFRSVDDEENREPLPYRIRVLTDQPPRVVLTVPGQDVKLPANGVLNLEGQAHDDFGVTGMTLQMQIEKGARLPPRPYRNGVSFKLVDDTYPPQLDYRDFVELEKLGVPLEPGMVLEYWLEAADNCDYPGRNVGKSDVYKVFITEPEKDAKKQDQQRQQAQKQQKEHEQKQDRQQEQLNQEARQRQQEQARNDQGKKESKEQQKLQEQIDKIRDALAKKDKQDAKDPADDGNADNKPEPIGPPSDKPKANEPKAGEPKADEPKAGEPKAGEPKAGKPKAGEPKAGQPKAGEPKAGQPKAGEPKAGEPKAGEPKAGEPKAGEPKAGQPKAGEPKAGEPKAGEPKAGEPKAGEPKAGEPKAGEPKAGQPKAGEPKAGEPRAGEPKAGEPKAGQPKAGEPKAGEPKASEPKAGQPKAGEPKAGEPKAGEPKAGEPKAGEPKASEPKAGEPKAGQPKAGEPKAGEPKASEPKAGEPKAGQPKAGEPKAGEPKASEPKAGEPKAGQPKAGEPKAGEPKAGEPRAGEPKAGEPKAGEPKAGTERDLTPQELADLKKALKSGDPKEKQEAIDRLQQAAEGAQDPKVQQDAAEALKQAGIEPKGKPEGQDPNVKGGTPTPKTLGPGEATPQPGKGGGDQGKASGPGSGKNGDNPAGGGDPGAGKQGSNASSSSGDPRGKDAVNPNDRRRAGDMTLEEARKVLTPDMLKKLGWSEKDKEAFLRALAEEQRRREEEDKVGPQRGGSLANTGPRQVQPGSTDPSDPRHFGPTQVPPELRNLYKEWTEEISRLKKKK